MSFWTEGGGGHWEGGGRALGGAGRVASRLVGIRWGFVKVH